MSCFMSRFTYSGPASSDRNAAYSQQVAAEVEIDVAKLTTNQNENDDNIVICERSYNFLVCSVCTYLSSSILVIPTQIRPALPKLCCNPIRAIVKLKFVLYRHFLVFWCCGK